MTYRPYQYVRGHAGFGDDDAPEWLAPELDASPKGRAATITTWTGLRAAQLQHRAAFNLKAGLKSTPGLTHLTDPRVLVTKLLEKELLPMRDGENSRAYDRRRHHKRIVDWTSGGRAARVDDFALLRVIGGDWTMLPSATVLDAQEADAVDEDRAPIPPSGLNGGPLRAWEARNSEDDSGVALRRLPPVAVIAAASPLLAESAERLREDVLGDLFGEAEATDDAGVDGADTVVDLLDAAVWEGGLGAGYATGFDYKLTCWLDRTWIEDVAERDLAVVGGHFVCRADRSSDGVWALRLRESDGFFRFSVDRAQVQPGGGVLDFE